jgi:hypothetical protein
VLSPMAVTAVRVRLGLRCATTNFSIDGPPFEWAQRFSMSLPPAWGQTDWSMPEKKLAIL